MRNIAVTALSDRRDTAEDKCHTRATVAMRSAHMVNFPAKRIDKSSGLVDTV